MSHSVEQRSEFLKRVLERCLKSQRSIGLKYLRILSDPEGRNRFLASTKIAATRFIDRHKTGATPYSMRILEKFALVFSVASCLPMLGLVPWTGNAGERAVEAIFLRYLNHDKNVFVSEREVLKKLYEAVDRPGQFRRRRNVRNFRKYSGIGLKLQMNKKKIIGICRNSNGISSIVERELGVTLENLEKLLFSHGLLIRNRQDKCTLSVSVGVGDGQSSKFRFLPINYLKLRTIVQGLGAG